MRGSWKDDRTTFVAAKAGEILTSHGHYDVGTFALDALGKRWFRDLGKESYSIGSPTEDLYRYRAEGHNTLVIEPGLGAGNVKPSVSPLIAFQGKTGGAGAFAIYDLSPAHSAATRVWRGFRLVGNRSEVLLQDEIQASTGRSVWWFAHYASPSTVADLSPDGTSVTLTQGAERLWCKIVSGGGTFQIMDAAPLPSSPNPASQTVNSGYKKLAINLANVTNTTLAVWFVPLETDEPIPATLPDITPLDSWQIDPANFPPTAGSTTVVSINDQPVDIDLSTLAEDDTTPAAALTYAVDDAAAGSVILLPDGHTARFTPTPGASGLAGFTFTATDAGGLVSEPGLVTVGGSPITYTWTSLTSGNWSTAANWESATPATSYRGANVRFLTGQSLSSGTTVTATNDLPGVTQMNVLTLNGGGSGTRTVNLNGNPIQLVANGPTLPAIDLSGPTSGFTYNINTDIELAADTTFDGPNSGRVNFNGVLSGSGGFTRTGSYTDVYFGNNNTYTGPTVIGTRGLFVGLSGTTSTTGTLGLGDVHISGPITFQRSNDYDVANQIGGSGGIVHNGAGTLTLNPENTYTGSTLVYRGVLVADLLNSVNGGEPLLPASSLGAPVTVAAGTIGLGSSSSSGVTLRYTGTGETTDRVINLRSATSNATLDHSGAGLLKFTGNFTATGAGTKTLFLTGSTTGVGELAGAVVDNSSTNKTNLAKSGTGTWVLSGNSTYTGTTSVNGGTLVVNGALTSPATLTVGASGRLAGSGTLSSPITVTGILAPGAPFGNLATTGSASFGSASRLIWELGGHSLALADRFSAGSVTITSGARIDVVLNASGASTHFLHSFWRTPRNFPVVTASTRTGSFTLGTVSTDSAGNPAASYGAFSLQHTSTGVNLLWTPIDGLPVIDDPTLTLVSPAQPVVSLIDTAHHLRLHATITGGDGTTFAWTQLTGPGTASIADASSPDTHVSFPAAGSYTLRGTVTNALGSVSTDLTIHVAQPTTFVLREGVDDYTHQATFVRGDSSTWNSGARNQVIVGRNGAPFRTLLSFDIPALEPGARVESVSLDFWIAENGSGATPLGTLELRKLLTPSLDGIGTGTSSTNGTGTGADWITRTGTSDDPWSTPGLGSAADYAPEVLASVGNLVPANLPAGTPVSLVPNGNALIDAIVAAAGSPDALGFQLTSATDTSLANHFIRLASNDNATPEWRPRLTIVSRPYPAPSLSITPVAPALVGEAVPLLGAAGDAISTLWSVVSGPGQVVLTNASALATTATFSAAGDYGLRLPAANNAAEISQTVAVTVTSPLSALEQWRLLWFDTSANTGDAADLADPDHDGEVNLLEFATGQNPHAASLVVSSLEKTATGLEFHYTRSKAAVQDGVAFDVEFSDTLTPPWSSAGPGEVVADDGTMQTMLAVIPAGSAGQRFVRLKVSK